jgi:sporulation protein YlmC with PRC-barrel domain
MKTHVMTLALTLVALPLCLPASAQTTQPSTPASFVNEQPAGQWLAHVLFGAKVQSGSGDVIGDINDLVFDPSGKITTVVLGVGGFLGLGEKSVAVPYDAVTFKVGPDGARTIIVALTKEQLTAAPAFKATEKTTYEGMRDKAVAMGQSAAKKGVELKDQAIKKVEGMTTDAAKKP